MHPFARPAGRHRRVRPAAPRPARPVRTAHTAHTAAVRATSRVRYARAVLVTAVLALLTAGGLAAAGGTVAAAAPARGTTAGAPAPATTPAVAPTPRPATTPATTPTPGPGTPLDGFLVTWTPPGLGSQISDFGYEQEGVRFASRVWESGSDSTGHRVDLDVHVLRGAALSGGPALRRYLARYLEKDGDWPLDPVRIGPGRGYLSDDGDVFWPVRPGVAIWVSIDQDRFGRDALLRTAQGVREPSTPTHAGTGGPHETVAPVLAVRALRLTVPVRAGQRTSPSAS